MGTYLIVVVVVVVIIIILARALRDDEEGQSKVNRRSRRVSRIHGDRLRVACRVVDWTRHETTKKRIVRPACNAPSYARSSGSSPDVRARLLWLGDAAAIHVVEGIGRIEKEGQTCFACRMKHRGSFGIRFVWMSDGATLTSAERFRPRTRSGENANKECCLLLTSRIA